MVNLVIFQLIALSPKWIESRIHTRLKHQIEPKEEMVHHGQTFITTFDSRAECSLIKQKISVKLVGKRITNVVMIKDIVSGGICSTWQILSNVKISQHCIEVLIHVVHN